MTRWPLRLLAALIALSGMSCGGGDPGSLFDTIPDINYEDKVEPPEGSEYVEDRAEPEIPVGQLRYEIILLHDTSAPLPVMIGDSEVIHAEVLDLNAYAQPAVGVAVYFEITSQTDLQDQPTEDGDAQVGAVTAYTGDQGVANVPFSCGLVADRKYRVNVYMPDNDYDGYPDANPKTIDFVCASQPCACVNVSLLYEGGLPETALSDFKIHVVPADWGCDKLFPDKPVPASLADRTIADLHGSTTFECLPADNYYTLYVTAKGPHACVAAEGCNDGVYLKPDTCKEANVELYMTVLNPTGMYDSIDHFDFTNLLKECAGGDVSPADCINTSGGVGKVVCCVLLQIINFFETPGSFIMDLVMDIVKEVGGIWGTLADLALGWLKDAIGKVLDNWIINNSPQWLQDFFKIGQDMMGIITNLELYSDLMISKLNNNFTVQGKQYWTGIALYWKIGCNPADPGYDECGKIFFTLDDIKNTQFPMDLVAGSFTASIADFDKLIENLHAIKLNYGKLVLFVLNELIIANITGGQAHSIVEAAKLWLDCKGISQGILGEIIGWFTGNQQDVENLCNGMIDFLLTPVQMFIGALTLDTQLSLQGNGILVDSDCDLKVDEIVKGVYQGFMETSGSQQASFTGKFEAKKKK
jgi:hypothetical protein